MKFIFVLLPFLAITSSACADTYYNPEKSHDSKIEQKLDVIIYKMEKLDEILNYLKSEFSSLNSFDFDSCESIHPRIEEIN